MTGDSSAIKSSLIRVREPGAFVRRVIGAEPTEQQAKVLAYLDGGERRIAVRSGHGVGKSALLAWILLWWISTRPFAIIPCTAPTAHQLEDVLWGEVVRWHRNMREPFRSLLTVGKKWIRHRESPEDWFAVARTARRENPEALQGFHGKHLAFLIDEASGVPEEVFEVAEGALSTPGSLVVMVGNPTRREGAFFRAFHSDRPHWKTLHLPSTNSSLVDPQYSERMKKRYGEDSDVYRVRVKGDFPSAEPDALVGLSVVEAAVGKQVEIQADEPLVYGVDVARFGDDETVLLRRRGVLVEGLESWRNLDTMQTSAKVAAMARAQRPSLIFVDVVGIGAGVADRLREMGLPVHPVNVSERPADQVRFDDLRSELWWRLRQWLEGGNVSLPTDDELVAQISTIKYGLTGTGKMRIESKRDRKKRGLASPDRADALMMTFAAAAIILPPQFTREHGANTYESRDMIDWELGF